MTRDAFVGAIHQLFYQSYELERSDPLEGPRGNLSRHHAGMIAGVHALHEAIDPAQFDHVVAQVRRLWDIQRGYHRSMTGSVAVGGD